MMTPDFCWGQSPLQSHSVLARCGLQAVIPGWHVQLEFPGGFKVALPVP